MEVRTSHVSQQRSHVNHQFVTTFESIFARPFQMWEKGTCRGYADEALHREFLAKQQGVHAKTPKELRREGARRQKSEPHYDGLSNPSGARW